MDEHSLHSPFLFDFYTNVLKKKFIVPELDLLRDIKGKLKHDHRIIHVTDLGGGSLSLKTPLRKIADIARVSTTPEKFSMLYAHIIQYYKCKRVLELGTSIGVNTLYLAKSHDAVQVITFEGSPEIANIAQEQFKETKCDTIRIIEGNLDQTLPAYLSAIDQIDFAFIDANHRLEPTVRYVKLLMEKIHPHSILIIDDIHYSKEMEAAWHIIQRNDLVYTTIDLYRCGLIFFNPSLTKQNVVLQF